MWVTVKTLSYGTIYLLYKKNSIASPENRTTLTVRTYAIHFMIHIFFSNSVLRLMETFNSKLPWPTLLCVGKRIKSFYFFWKVLQRTSRAIDYFQFEICLLLYTQGLISQILIVFGERFEHGIFDERDVERESFPRGYMVRSRASIICVINITIQLVYRYTPHSLDL